jgi:hypothetical protein
MRIYTSYFGNLRALGKEGLFSISIARYTPKWFTGARYLDVAPTPFMLSSACTQSMYVTRYEDILKSLKPDNVIRQIEQMSGGRDVALLCFEKPGEFCHRHMLADWLNKNTSYNVEEWQPEARNEAQQLSLFD